ncbi:ion transporter [Rufibacter glacialis]|uniref:Ion transporter n=1 Tax=Rufibacter glacialis TaxID=1259555 RepID=A0A5M8QEM1_9BACT|nr:ion transporter [Rufibacter glacialis]KAA6434487.1 ion transporter [Rufibacter glacialis]GGK70075.1 ion transporter [Rufibacter glacialis]
MRNAELRKKIYQVIHGTDTKAGRRFDVALLWMILLSTLIVCLESVPAYRAASKHIFFVLEWMFTIAFTLEYILRVYSNPRPLRYIFSFYGIIDFLSILPTFLAIFVPSIRYIMTIRVLRLLRVFRILKLTSYVENGQIIKKALIASFHKITVFIMAVFSLVLIVGTLMYVVEGESNGFTSIPQSIYWAIVTITTVGYGDLTPHTPLGQVISSIVMLMGYAIIAVPTGIVTVELSRMKNPGEELPAPLFCGNCSETVHKTDNFCRNCGHPLLP